VSIYCTINGELKRRQRSFKSTRFQPSKAATTVPSHPMYSSSFPYYPNLSYPTFFERSPANLG